MEEGRVRQVEGGRKVEKWDRRMKEERWNGGMKEGKEE
jgi:hypothetical protein